MFLLTILFCSFLFVSSSSPTDVLIIGGTPTSLNTYPWIVGIASDSVGVHCVGAIVSERYILTAAHCVADSLNDRFIIAGRVNLDSEDGQTPSVTSIETKWMKGTAPSVGDIALLKVEPPLSFSSSVSAIAIAKPSDVQAVGDMNTCGWGLTRAKDESSASRTLQCITLPLYSQESCIQKFKPIELPGDVFCYGGKAGKGVCDGDSGAPLWITLNGTTILVGVNSFGSGTAATCANQDDPTVAVSVAYHANWIESIIPNTAPLQLPINLLLLALSLSVHVFLEYGSLSFSWHYE